MSSWVTTGEDPCTLDPIEPTSMALSIVRGLMIWWEMVRPDRLGMDEDEDEDEEMDITPSEITYKKKM